MSGFVGIDIALRGLYSSQKSLEVVNHNLNNVNTPGYSRQKATQVASRAMSTADGTGMIGMGSDVISVDRIRDEYLDYKYWSESTVKGEWDVKETLLTDMESAFNEPSDSGFNVILNDFFSSLQELGKDPGSPAVRSLIRERGVTVAKYYNGLATQFEKYQEDVNFRINAKVVEVNSIGVQLQKLNSQIYSGELQGDKANDLRDQRTVLIDKISRIVNCETEEVIAGVLPNGKEDKRLVIKISGKAFIDHFNLSKLSVEKRITKVNEEDLDSLYSVGWEDGNSLEIKGGELKGYLDIRDGNEGDNGTEVYKGVPFYLKKINAFVRTFAMAFNEGYIDRNTDGIYSESEDELGHVDGYGTDPDGENGPLNPPTGLRFFTMKDNEDRVLSSDTFIDGEITITGIEDRYKNITAKNFAVSEDVINDYNSFAASSDPEEVGNIVNLNKVIQLRHDWHLFAEGAPEDYMQSLVATLGIDAQQSKRLTENQDLIVRQLDNRRLSDSGVSMDEEMGNMVKFQHSYVAAAKMISTMSEIYDILINRVGM